MKKTFRRKRAIRKKRRYTKKRFARANRVQRLPMDQEKRVFSRTLDVRLDADTDDFSAVISLFGAKNASAIANTITVSDMEQNGVLRSLMTEYQSFSITGVAFKYIPTGVTQYDIRPSAITVAYSNEEVFYAPLIDERLHCLPTYQIMAVDPCKPISRYYSTAAVKRR
jgi:hypothetical protein